MKIVSQFLPIVAIAALTTLSCQKEAKENNKTSQTVREDTTQVTAGQTQKDTASFDPESVPVSEKDLGQFPFFTLPKGLKPLNKPVEKKYDKLFFPLGGVMTPVEGKVWRSFIAAENGTEDWSLAYFEKSYHEAILAAGGVKVFEGQISRQEFDRYNKLATYLGDEGAMGYPEEQITVYLIRRSAGDDVYIQLTGNDTGGKLNILQKEPFKQTISIISSTQIQKDLQQKGKAVLHINFDTDKATLTKEGIEAVGEIVKVLQQNKDLKIAVNGYTDNSGSREHNLDLSRQRATAVKNRIGQAGIDAGRLTVDGFGQDNPIADNSSEEGRAQNRRVELIRR
jgi:outer membrane protein OmpA-like peptidoglycan-associated protein